MRSLATIVARPLLAASLVILLAACRQAAPALTPKEDAFMSTYTAHLVPRCFGRYLVDLPADMKLAPASGTTFAIAPYSEMSGAIDVTVTPMPKSVFDTQLAQRKATLQSEHIDLHPEWPYLGQVVPLADNSGVIFDRSQDGGSRGARTLELHGWKDDYAIKMTINAGDDSYPEYQKLSKNLQFGNDVPQKLAQLQALYARIRGRADGAIPTDPGACFKGGFVSGPASASVSEDITVNYVSKSFPNVHMTLSSNGGIGADNTLLERVPDMGRLLDATHGRFISKGKAATKSGVDFEQVLTEMPTGGDRPPNLLYLFEANSKLGSAQAPLLTVKLQRTIVDVDTSGQPINPELLPASTPTKKTAISEAESVDLWHAVTDSVRKRPGAF